MCFLYVELCPAERCAMLIMEIMLIDEWERNNVHVTFIHDNSQHAIHLRKSSNFISIFHVVIATQNFFSRYYEPNFVVVFLFSVRSLERKGFI